MTEDHQSDAIALAIQIGAPAEAAWYRWTELEIGGEIVSGVGSAGDGYLRAHHSKTTPLGTVRVGWNQKARHGVWSWDPAQ